MGPVWANQDVPTSTQVLPTSIPYGRTQMPPYLPELTHIGPMMDFYMGPKWDFLIFAPSMHMGPV